MGRRGKRSIVNRTAELDRTRPRRLSSAFSFSFASSFASALAPGPKARLLGLLCFALGCAGSPIGAALPVTPEMLRDAVDTLPAVEPGTLRVALAFGGDADLDLAVTDAQFDSVRFARPLGARGGHFSADRGCGDPAPRVETIEWKNVCPGRFVISIKHASDCVLAQPEQGALERRWQLRIDHEGVERKEGRIEDGAFLSIVFEVEPSGAPIAGCRR